MSAPRQAAPRFLACLLICLLIPVALRAQAYLYGGQWGSFGNGPSLFNTAYGLATDAAGNVYVSDEINNRVQVFRPGGVYVRGWGIGGTADGQLNAPYGLAVSKFGAVFVAEFGNNRISKFDSLGVFLGRWGSTGTGPGQFRNPLFVAVDDSGFVYVSENHRVQKFNGSGDFLLKWGSQGTGPGQFNFPTGVAARGGEVVVVDSHNNRVQVFNSMGQYLRQFGSFGNTPGKFSAPEGVALGPHQNIYVVDTNNSRVQRFDPAGVFLSEFGTPGSANGELSYPWAVAVRASNGAVYVADTFNYRCEWFAVNPTVAADELPGRLSFTAPLNPVRGEAIARLSLPTPGAARVSVHDAAGRLLATLADGTLVAGKHDFTWNLLRPSGERAPAGLYFVRLQAGSEARTLKWVVVR